MPRKYYRRTRIRYSTEQIRHAADAIVPVAKTVVEDLIKRCMEIKDGKTRAPRRPPGRGSQLTPPQQLLVMFWAQTVSDRPREIGAQLGMHPRTVARVLSSTKYKKLDAYVASQVLASMGGVRGFIRSLR